MQFYIRISFLTGYYLPNGHLPSVAFGRLWSPPFGHLRVPLVASLRYISPRLVQRRACLNSDSASLQF
ncbi:hypothetical protein M6B38_195585 [Iris pallida]|uniref:Uncharacterized protein n=1 Tax=Iris pallida TaxID=29817 RepID=A0AAX6ECF6_IRIPA|nr:hypothetical protein M6B38_195585 [Iris pallida]